MDDQNKNLILATALSFLVILVWFFLFPPEQPIVDPNAPVPATTQADGTAAAPPIAGTPPAAVAPSSAEVRETALADDVRIQIETPELKGTISLTGGRLDDLKLSQYRETLEEDADIVTLLSPVGTANAYYALYGWAPAGDLTYEQVPGANTEWQLVSGDTLTPDSPITLAWSNEAGLTFNRTISVDEEFMFTVEQTVTNTSGQPRRLQPYGIVARHGEPDTIGFFILHEGMVAMNDGELAEVDYDDMTDFDVVAREAANAQVTEVAGNGWIGFTDKYWMTTLIPTPGSSFTSVAKFVPGAQIFQTETRLPIVDVAPGATATVSSQLFAGAKEWEAIRSYEQEGVEGFLDSIDWGWFFFLTKPIFAVLHWLNIFIGNMGWSIVVLTLLIKAILLPLAYKSYVSMAKMKELQPQMEKIKEKAGDDRQKLQTEMMALYKKEKVNPAAGCLPILLQIPIFFSLYKVIFVTIELRHAPWFGPFQDLSAPDPTSIINLFGLLPNEAPHPESLMALIFIGILPLILGISMWLQQKLNPAPTDPTQQMIFAWMPWVFMFMLGGFASGLVVYWIANNIITFTQQYAIMRSQGYKPDLFGNIKASFKKGDKPVEDKPKAKK
ncbi:protein translocase subunit yidC [Litoreibacter ponti]|uniref:Membrane protein insertase YidC n=1 Tax=Litoreibacter ponti TaxID=1510457 RepID=A0A2T6BEQ4_9RHOB|nr:membrane protein insertase YidC [Litoreibacter ponti]PTX54543.1 protein translocase subunit yidC [Litoreibacter ponti]